MGRHTHPLAPPKIVTARGTPACRGPALFRGHPVASLDGGPMERPAPEVGQPQYVLATAEAVGRNRGALEALASVLGPAQ
jgi:hypothetical protein